MQLPLFIIIAATLSSITANAQDSLTQIPAAFIKEIADKATNTSQSIDDRTKRILNQVKRQEEKMKNRLLKIDPSKTNELFGNIEERYRLFKDQLQSRLSSTQYIPSLDTLKSSLRFFQQNLQLIAQLKDGEQKLQAAIDRINDLDNRFQIAEEIRKFLTERNQFLRDQLGRFGLAHHLKKLDKEIYYFSQQVHEYRELLKDHKKAGRKVIEWLTNSSLFRQFMRRHSLLSGLFRLPGDPVDPLIQSSLDGLQTRVQVNNLIQQQVGNDGRDALDQVAKNMHEAQAYLTQLKNKLTQQGSNELNMPERFKPNSQKTKSFRKRIEFGTNTQSQKAKGFFPVTTDIGISLGYKLNDKSIVGIGASYKLGWGRDWNHIKFTHEGIGLRTYIDWKIKGSSWITGGYEQNYNEAFRDIIQLRQLSAWRQSGLLGLTKILPLRTKLFRKTKFQLLWDFLSYRQLPKTPALVTRIGYTF